MIVREVISLGRSCQINWFLKTRNLRRSTYIFDNMIADQVESVTSLLSSGFVDFFLEENVEVIKRNMWNCYTVLDRKNGVFSVHDFSQKTEIEESFVEVRQNKLNHGAELLQLIKTCPQNLLFVRVNNDGESLDKTVRLYDTLSTLRDMRPFHLFVFQRHNMMKSPWGLPNVTTFYDGPWEFDRGAVETGMWRGDIQLWDAIFKNVVLES